MTMRSLIASIYFTTVCSFVLAAEHEPILDIYSLSVQELSQLTISSGRVETPINQITSVMTVITAEQLELSGVTNVAEALQRINGMLFIPGWDYTMGHRGIANDLILYLIDGQPINNKSVRGLFQVHLFPNINMIKQIEVVHSPSAVIWGPGATLAVINLITLDPEDLELSDEQPLKIELAFDYDVRNQRYIASLLGAWESRGGLKTMFSANYSESNGPIYDIFLPGEGGPASSSIVNPFQPVGNSFHRYFPSLEVYIKMFYEKWTLKARIYDWDEAYAGNASIYGDEYHRNVKNQYLALTYATKLSETWRLENTLRYENASSEQFWPNPSVRTGDYHGISEDLLLIRDSDNNVFKFGFQGRLYEFDDVREIGFPGASFGNVPQASGGQERNWGVFIDNDYKGFEDWIITAGIRFETNNLRSDFSGWFPRFAANYQINDQWQINYSFNTGISYPNIEQNWGSFDDRIKTAWDSELNVIGAHEPQTSSANDIQLKYVSDNFSAAITAYSLKLENYIDWIGYETLIGEERFLYANQNVIQLNSSGLEFKSAYIINKMFNVYGNISYNETGLQDRTFTVADGAVDLPTIWNQFNGRESVAMPDYLWNFGINGRFTENLRGNIHYRGWAGSKTRLDTTTEQYSRLEPQHLFDINLIVDNFLDEGLTLNVYARNIGSSTYKIGHWGNGYSIEQGASYGFGLTYRK